MEKGYREMLTEALKDLDSGTGQDNMKRQGIGKSLVALTMVLGDVDDKLNRIIGSIHKTGDNLGDFNKSSGKLQVWLIAWTAIMAVAAIIALLK